MRSWMLFHRMELINSSRWKAPRNWSRCWSWVIMEKLQVAEREGPHFPANTEKEWCIQKRAGGSGEENGWKALKMIEQALILTGGTRRKRKAGQSQRWHLFWSYSRRLSELRQSGDSWKSNESFSGKASRSAPGGAWPVEDKHCGKWVPSIFNESIHFSY